MSKKKERQMFLDNPSTVFLSKISRRFEVSRFQGTDRKGIIQVRVHVALPGHILWAGVEGRCEEEN